ncbi:hypothetical protein MNB_SUP05-5-1165 [hydrothermal vent metagenome]|uniref:DUF4156 domain-containing protein n=1 Tax=hydrothermal vent metagenome TaxID=652676 RepID=A0A1W1CW00_9ZZZZ
MKRIIILITTLFLISCGETRLSDEGATISVVERINSKCKYIGDVEGSYNNIIYGEFIDNKTLEKNAINDLKDKAYKMGADTIIAPVGSAKGGLFVDIIKWRAVYSSKAYKCRK